MKKRLLFGGILLSFMIGTQAYWLSRSYDANTSQFDHQVQVALYNVADTISDKASVEKVSSNYFFVTTNSSASSETIDTLIQKEFSARNLKLDYELGIYNAEDDSLMHGEYVQEHLPVAGNYAVEQDQDQVPKNFAVLFPTKKSFLLGKLDLWLFVVLILILISSYYLHPYFHSSSREIQLQATASQINLGKTSLDYHNQNLVVDGNIQPLTYKENKILKLFFENPNQVIEREVFLEEVWQRDGFFTARSMDVFISKIRKYINPDQSIKIVNLRSIGYRLHVSDQKKS